MSFHFISHTHTKKTRLAGVNARPSKTAAVRRFRRTSVGKTLDGTSCLSHCQLMDLWDMLRPVGLCSLKSRADAVPWA